MVVVEEEEEEEEEEALPFQFLTRVRVPTLLVPAEASGREGSGEGRREGGKEG